MMDRYNCYCCLHDKKPVVKKCCTCKKIETKCSNKGIRNKWIVTYEILPLRQEMSYDVVYMVKKQPQKSCL